MIEKDISKATPRPWVKNHREQLRAPSGAGVYVWTATFGVAGRDPETEANAALIVEAVNSYDTNLAEIASLKAEVERLREALTGLVDEYCDYTLINNLGDPEGQHNIKRARAALTQEPTK